MKHISNNQSARQQQKKKITVQTTENKIQDHTNAQQSHRIHALLSPNVFIIYESHKSSTCRSLNVDVC